MKSYMRILGNATELTLGNNCWAPWEYYPGGRVSGTRPCPY
jgi:hypothetical protein